MFPRGPATAGPLCVRDRLRAGAESGQGVTLSRAEVTFSLNPEICVFRLSI